MVFNEKDKIFSFRIPGRLPSANNYIQESKTSFYLANELKKKSDSKIIASLIDNDLYNKKIKKDDYPLTIHIVWNEPYRKNKSHRRDFDNIIFGSKFILDGMVNGGLIDDDNLESYIHHIHNDVIINKEDSYIDVVAYSYKKEHDDYKQNKNPDSFAIEGRLAGTNQFIGKARGHWSVASKCKKEEQLKVHDGLREYFGLNKKIDYSPISMHIEWNEGKITSRSKLRDFDNITFGLKFILDEMVNYGLIIDDSPDIIKSITNEIKINVDDPHIVVKIMPTEGSACSLEKQKNKNKFIKRPY